MSRSIHANRSWRLFEQRGFRDWAAINTKKRVKRGVKQTRNFIGNTTVHQQTLVLPKVVLDYADKHIFFPVSREDVCAVFGALPGGVAGGLRYVKLESGIAYVNENAASSESSDPFVGRKGEEVYTGVYVPSVRGTYGLDTNDIRLFGYVKAPDTLLTADQHQELRFTMLRTLVHEVAHHVDRTSRVARGRWRMDNVEKDEQYADGLAMKWCIDVVVPYLLDTYGQTS
jgi:hypothetical protein